MWEWINERMQFKRRIDSGNNLVIVMGESDNNIINYITYKVTNIICIQLSSYY
jgi:hypothetical protein